MDQYGHRGTVFLVVPIILLLVHILLAFTTVDPVGLLVGQGLAYAMFAAVFWPTISLVIEGPYVGLAYGYVISIFNMGMAVFPLLIAGVYVSSNDHYVPNVELVFVAFAFMALVLVVHINRYDASHESVLNSVVRLKIPDDTTDGSNMYSDYSYDGLRRTNTYQSTGHNQHPSNEFVKHSYIR